MILRDQIPKDQLLFETKIERAPTQKEQKKHGRRARTTPSLVQKEEKGTLYLVRLLRYPLS